MHSKQFCIHTASFSAYKQLGNTLKSPITACFLSIYLATDQSSQLLIIINGCIKDVLRRIWISWWYDVFVGNVYSSGVLLIIITQLADNFDVISPSLAACGGSPGPAAVSRVSKRGNEHEENTARPWWSQSGRIMRGLINDNPWKFLSTISHSDSRGTLLTRAL